MNTKTIKKVTFLISILLTGHFASAFCGFYVAKADVKLFNTKSQVIMVRDGKKTVVTMSSDFQGNISDFAMVIPVPEIVSRENIRIISQSVFDKLDAYSGPRLVEYYDPNPCNIMYNRDMLSKQLEIVEDSEDDFSVSEEKEKYEVKIEASYTVGEYDILVLSAKESDGLKRWLIDNGYKIPAKAERVLEPYIKSNMKFFVVKVNMAAQKLQGYQNLRPLQIGFNSEKFMLPLRLGMANSTGAQDMVVYAFTKTGRVEAANYRTVEMPTNREVPLFVKEKFGQFYVDLFDKSHKVTGKKSVFLEYSWDVSPSWNGVKCDPCVGPPPINNDLVQAGVWWLKEGGSNNKVHFTRLHVRYQEDLFPEDLHFIVTPNSTNFQCRYILRNPAIGNFTCEAGKKYMSKIKLRRQKELRELEGLTNWNTAKYTKYVDEGSNWIDERKNEIYPTGSGSNGPNDGMNNWIYIGALLLVIFVLGSFLIRLNPLKP